MGESATANVHFVVHPPAGETLAEVDAAELERRLTEASRSWRDDFSAAVLAEHGEDTGARLARKYVDSFPEAYKEDYLPATGSFDLGRLEELAETSGDADGIDLALYEQMDAGRGEARLKVFRVGPPLSLSEILPMLSSMGVEVVDERPYQLEGLGRPTYIYEFGLRYGKTLPTRARELFQDALRAVWDGYNEIDGFNALVLAAGLTWRQATVLRAYAKYMKQGNTPFALDYIEDALRQNVDITRLLVQLFESRFDPGKNGLPADAEARTSRIEAVQDKLERALDDVASLDHDRILRSYLTHIRATLRTNYFQRDGDGRLHTYMSLKMEPSAIPDLPEPRPSYEIFVYSPRVEGVHLRFGAVARGGLRWSDRRDDFRTEVLGLVKAQMVKNTVIVPVGAKGGFFCKQLPDSGDRDAWLAEGVACYKTFISGLLDITDNLVDGETVAPHAVVRHDGDDSYLVVAADKGTATFSDIANGVAKDYGFWLGDAFASGGSVGYDHKAMGITARGAWVSVQRHFRERGIDCQTEDFTAAGIGDMSGDVFGNGMLCSEHIRLVAAFDHRDIFLDPEPDAATSYAERRRLFEQPRSSWQDYDASLVSEGGGVFSRSLKSIKLNDAIRRSLGIDDDVTAMTPAELMKAILQAPVDLLWNGGIGTYVKAAEETHADAGDKANDAIRINGRELRARCVGEGGNLGLTQLGRIEYTLQGCEGDGGRINTDFIDNSAGVDTSDHEVNIKILLDRVVADGDLTEKQRNTLLAEMTDEVAELVLRDNYEQNLALANAAAHAPSLLHVHEDWMKTLERRGVLNRELEALPTSRQVRRRLDRGEALTTPELSVLLAWTKIVLADELLDSDLPDDPYLHLDLMAYFPTQMKKKFEGAGRRPSAAPGDHRDPGGQRPGQRRRDDVLAAADGGDRLDRRRADPGQLRGPRDLRLPRAARRDQGVGQQALGRRADPDADRDAHPRRARLPLAGQQPPPAPGQRGHGRVLQRAGAEGDAGAAGAGHRPDPDRVRGTARPVDRAGRPGGPGDPGGGARPGVPAARARRHGTPGEARPVRGDPAALRPRRAARAARAGPSHLRPAPRGPVADDGPRFGPRRPLRRAHPADRPGAALDVARGLGAGPDRGLGGRRAGGGRPRRQDAGGDLRRRLRRPRADVGRPARRAGAAEERLGTDRARGPTFRAVRSI